LRIIAGSIKGRRLRTLEPGDLRIRPTADRAREALFSILQRWPQGTFLELFGGTGAVALEAWSRGYAPVHCVESAPAAFPLLEANCRGTEVAVLRKDVRKLPSDQFRGVAVLFADPPYESAVAFWKELAPTLQNWISPTGVVVWETDERTDLPDTEGWEVLEIRRYGAARFLFLTLR